MAISASVAGHCQPCFRRHLANARELGIPEDDIRNTIVLAKTISEKGDLRMFEFTEGLMKE